MDGSVGAKHPNALTIGTRGSKLALWQTEHVRDLLMRRFPQLAVDYVRITTKGDAITDRPLAAIGRNSLFVAEIEDALRSGRIHLAVHSAKDLPSTLADDMRIAAFLSRVDPRDALVSRGGTLAELPHGAKIGTSSPRRACQLRAARPDVQLLDIRGNVDTRLDKLHRGEFDAIVLAAAGLERLGLAHHVTQYFSADEMVPAVAQGALAIEVCTADPSIEALIAPLADPVTTAAVVAERAFLAAMGAGCNAPLAAHATIAGNTLTLTALIGASDGRLVRQTVTGAPADAATLGRTIATELVANGGAELLAAITGASHGG
jgi:hydroxymethylbilane synthase